MQEPIRVTDYDPDHHIQLDLYRDAKTGRLYWLARLFSQVLTKPQRVKTGQLIAGVNDGEKEMQCLGGAMAESQNEGCGDRHDPDRVAVAMGKLYLRLKEKAVNVPADLVLMRPMD